MADKPSYTTVAADGIGKAATTNANNEALAAAIEGCLGRGGTDESPNSMTGNLDMDDNKIINVGTPTSDGDAANKAYVDILTDADAIASAVADAEDAQTAAETAQGLAEDARDDAQTAQGLAEDARDGAEAAEAAAEGYRDEALAAVGAVKVSTNDTTPGVLNGKLVAGSGFALTEGSDGGDETLTIEIGTAADARDALGLGTAALADIGTGEGDVVAVQAGGKLPALDGSDLTGISGGGLADWSSLSGAATIPTIVSHGGAYYALLANVADVTTEEPGMSGFWGLVSTPYAAEYLLCAGGGGASLGAGGGGGVLTDIAYLTPGETYAVVVGAGGSAGADGTLGGDGGDTTFNSLTAVGGGGGGTITSTRNGQAGGSGGGAGYEGSPGAGTSGQGYAGGEDQITDGTNYSGGGGGGGSEVGAAGSSASGGDGGEGISSDITGATVVYGSGGGGGAYYSGAARTGGTGGTGAGNGAANAAGAAGTDGVGGGGGGGRGGGGAGGDGVAILRILTALYSGTTAGSPTVTTDGDYTIVKFTGSGSYTA